MKRRTLRTWQTLGQIEFAVFALLAALALATGLSGSLDEAGHHARWYQVVGLALEVMAFGLPGLAVDCFVRRALRRCSPGDDAGRGFEPVLKSDK
jgi:hypothetical protein